MGNDSSALVDKIKGNLPSSPEFNPIDHEAKETIRDYIQVLDILLNNGSNDVLKRYQDENARPPSDGVFNQLEGYIRNFYLGCIQLQFYNQVVEHVEKLTSHNLRGQFHLGHLNDILRNLGKYNKLTSTWVSEKEPHTEEALKRMKLGIELMKESVLEIHEMFRPVIDNAKVSPIHRLFGLVYNIKNCY